MNPIEPKLNPFEPKMNPTIEPKLNPNEPKLNPIWVQPHYILPKHQNIYDVL